MKTTPLTELFEDTLHGLPHRLRRLPLGAVSVLLLPLTLLLAGCGFRTHCFEPAGCMVEPGILAMTAASVNTLEGSGPLALQVARTGGASGAVSVHFQTADGSAVAGTDYTPVSGTLSWAAGDASPKTISVTILNQRQGTASVGFSVGLSAVTGGATLGSPASTTVSIADNGGVSGSGLMPGTLQFSSDTFGSRESAGSVALSVTRLGGSTGAVSVDFQTVDGTAVAGAGYTRTSGTLSWADGDSVPKTITVPVLDAKLTSGAQSFSVNLSTPVGGAILGLPFNATVTIADDDVLPGTLQLSAPAYATCESAGSVALAVTRTGGSSGAVAVNYATANGTATAGTAYTTTNGTLTWAAGDLAPKTITVPILDQKLTSGAMSFTVTLSSPGGGATLGSPAAATVTIANNDVVPGTLQLSAAGYTTSESAGSVALAVTRTGGSSGAVAVNYATADGSAVAGTGYTAVAGTLRWADGDASAKTITVPVLDQRLTAGSQSFAVNLSAATGGAMLGAPAAATVTIADNDVVPGTLQLAAVDYPISESGGSVMLTVTRTGGLSGNVSVLYATADGSAAAPTAYTATSGRLSWADGDGSARTVAVPILDQRLATGSQTFTLALSAPGGGATLGSPAMATVTIVDNDVLPGALQFSTSTYATSESAGSILLQVSRTGGSSGAVAVDYTSANGSAAAGAAFTVAAGTLRWADGDLSPKTVSVGILDQHLTAGSQAFTVALSGTTGGASLGSPNVASVTIADNDTPPGTLQLTAATETVSESVGSAMLLVSRTGGSSGAVTVTYATSNGSAVAGTAYSTTLGTLNWSDGDSANKAISVPILDQRLANGSQSFSLVLSGATGGATLGSPNSVLVTIADNDVLPGTVQLTASTAATSESAGSVLLGVTRTGGTSGAASVGYTTANGTALAGSAYTATAGILNWADGDSSARTIVVPILDQHLTTGSPSFSVELGQATGGVGLGSPTVATVTIADNDVLPGSIQLTAATAATSESAGSVALQVTRTGGSSGAVSVGYATANGSAAAGLAYTAATGTLRWADGDSSAKTITVPVLDQHLTAGSAAFTVALSGPTGGAALGSPASAVVTIADNDVLPGSIQLSAAGVGVNESSGAVILVVSRTGGSSGAVSVSYGTVNGTALAGTAYTGTSGTLSWADGDASTRTLSVPLLDVHLTSGSESFSVVLSGVTGGATLGSPSAALITIADNDVLGSSVQLSAATDTTTELAGWLVLQATRTGSTTGAVSVTYATSDGTGLGGEAYGAAGGTLTWADGDSSPKLFTVPILDQQLSTGSQTFNVTLSAPVGTALGTPASAVVTITDNDAPYADFCNPQAAGADSTATFCTTMNWPIYGTPTLPLPANPTADPGDGLKLTATASNLFSLVMGTAVPGANVVTGQQVRNDFFLNYAVGLQNTPFGSPQDTGQADNSNFAAVARHYEVGDPNDVHVLASDGLHLRAICSANRTDCSPGHVWGSYIRPGVEIRPGMTVKVRYKSPAGPYAWAPVWMFSGAQYSPGPGGNAYQNYGTIYGLANYGTNGHAFEIDMNDNYPRWTNNPSVPVGEQVDYGFVNNYGVQWNVQPHYIYWANGSRFAYQTNTYPYFEQVPFNWSQGFHDLVLSWGTDNQQYEFVDGELMAVSYMEFPASTYVDGYAGGATKQVPMNLMIGNQAIPSFTPGGNLTTDNDGFADGWTMTVQEISVWNGTVANPYDYQIVGNGCTGCMTSSNIALGAGTYAVNENGGAVTLSVTRTAGSVGAVSAGYMTQDGTGVAGTAYTNTSGTLSWADGDVTPKTITIPILDQGLTSGSETFKLHLYSAVGNATLSSPQDAVITIANNDPPPPCAGCAPASPLPIINVRDYGAGLGAADDSAAISNAFAAGVALSTKNSNERVEIFFPAATYQIATGIPAIPNNMTVSGDPQGISKIVNSIPPGTGSFVMGTRDYPGSWQYLTIARADDTSLHAPVPNNSYTGQLYIYLAEKPDIAALRALGVPGTVTPGYAGLTVEMASGATLDETNGGSAPAKQQVTNNQVNPAPALLMRALAVDSTGKVTLDRPNSLNWGVDYNGSASLEEYYRPTNITSSSSFILGPGWLVPANNYHHDIVIQNLTFETSPQLNGDFANSWGLYVGYSYNVSVLNCTFQNISGYYPLLSVRAFNTVLDGNHFNVGSFYPIVLDSGSGYVLQNNHFQAVTNPFYNPDPNAEAHTLPQSGQGFIGLDEAPIDLTVRNNFFANLPVTGFTGGSVFSGTGGSSTRFTGNSFTNVGGTIVENFFVNRQYVFDSNRFVNSTASISPGSGERQFNAFNNSYSGSVAAPVGGGSSGIDFYDDSGSAPTYFGLNHGVKPQVFGSPKTLMAANTLFDGSPVTYYGIIYADGNGSYNGSGFLPVFGSLSPVSIQSLSLSTPSLHPGQAADVTVTLNGPADQDYPLYLLATAGDPAAISLHSFLITVPAGQTALTLPSEVVGVRPGSLTLSARSLFSTVPTGTSIPLSVSAGSATSQPVAAGMHTLTNGSSGLVLDGSPGVSNPPIQSSPDGSTGESWVFNPQPDGSYTIQNVLTGLLLADPSGEQQGSASPQPAAQQAAASETPAQRWLVLNVASGSVFKNLATGSVLEDPAANPGAGVALTVSPENDSAAQLWKITVATN